MNPIEMNQTFILAAYAVTWVVILGYFARLIRKSARSQAAFRDTGAAERGALR